MKEGMNINDCVTISKIDSNTPKHPLPYFKNEIIKNFPMVAYAACPDDFISILESFIGKL